METSDGRREVWTESPVRPVSSQKGPRPVVSGLGLRLYIEGPVVRGCFDKIRSRRTGTFFSPRTDESFGEIRFPVSRLTGCRWSFPVTGTVLDVPSPLRPQHTGQVSCVYHSFVGWISVSLIPTIGRSIDTEVRKMKRKYSITGRLCIVTTVDGVSGPLLFYSITCISQRNNRFHDTFPSYGNNRNCRDSRSLCKKIRPSL